MPRGDRTGPMGMGPKTGRAAGYCAGFSAPGCTNPTPGRGMGRGRGAAFGGGGRGRGRGTGFAVQSPSLPAGAPYAEKEALLDQANALQAQLDAIRNRLDALE